MNKHGIFKSLSNEDELELRQLSHVVWRILASVFVAQIKETENICRI